MTETAAAKAKASREGISTLALTVPTEFADQVRMGANITGVNLKTFMRDALSAYLVEVQPEIDAVLKARAARERKARTAKS